MSLLTGNLKKPLLSRLAANRRANKCGGSILVFALWSLCALAVFSVLLSYQMRQRISLVYRLDERDALGLVAEAGVKKAIFAVVKEKEESKEKEKQFYALKASWGSAGGSRAERLGASSFIIGYPGEIAFDGNQSGPGLIDEERKINLNRADGTVLKRLFQVVLGINDQEAQDLASGVVYWRSASGTAIEAGSYRGFEFPYDAKNAEFEIVDELLLVRGMTQERFDRLKNYITIYGSGRVNINTASKPALQAIGLSAETADALIAFRNGQDGQAGTEDDVTFEASQEILLQVESAHILSQAQAEQLQAVVGFLGVNSEYFTAHSIAVAANKKGMRQVESIFDAKGTILYWQET